MGKKIRAEMEAQRKIFVDGAIARGIPEAKATEVFDLMAKFADYGFNKSHAAAYALVAYQTAWMKANHPVVFIAACMSLALSNTDRLAALKQEAERHGHPHPAAGHQSLRRGFHRRAAGRRHAGDPLRAGGGEEGRTTRRCRRWWRARGDGRSPISPISRPASIRASSTRCSSRIWSAPARSTGWSGNRARLFAGAETILRRAQAEAEEKESGQIGLFGGGGKPEALRLPDMPDWPPMERLGFEAEAIGFHLTAHPLDAYAHVLRRLGAVPQQCSSRARARQGGAGEARRHRGRRRRSASPAPAAAWPGCGCPMLPDHAR